MTQRDIRAGVLTEAALLWILTAAALAADPSQQLIARAEPVRPHVELFHNSDTAFRLFTLDRFVGRTLRHRFHLELDGARAQAEDWLHSAGFSLLEERDAEGRRSYSVISAALTSDWPVIRMRARLGQPQVSAGLHARREMPAIGVMVPWEQYTFELEGIQDKVRGYLFMGTLRWSDPQQRVQYGIALPVGVGAAASVGALLQVRVRFAK